MSAAAVIVMRQNEFIRVYRAAGAVSPDTARTPAELGLRNSWVFRRLAARGVFLPAWDEHWYLNEPAAEAFVQRRRTIMFWFCAASLVLFILVIFGLSR